jgi:tRNA U34 5-methylaminomethyl-2-thiouridine-forming methyltransferase MnmC
MDVRLIKTEDGSWSLYRDDLNESYHSLKGALRESRYVYIQQGIETAGGSLEQVHVFEMGFGTGLNALLAYEWALKQQKQAVFHSCELYPIGEAVWTELNYPELMEQSEHLSDIFHLMHTAAWEVEVEIGPYFRLHKTRQSLQELQLEPFCYHVVFYDAFAPGKQADVWSKELLGKMYSCLKSEGILVTYCAMGQFKRDLKDLGFMVETLPGPPGKKEMVRAKKLT